MATPRRRWPKAANEAREYAINEAGEIQARIEMIQERIRELEKALKQRDMRGALAITVNLDNMFQLVSKSAELIVVKLESAPADDE